MVGRIRNTGGHGSILTAKGGSSGGDAPAFVASTSGQTSGSNNTVMTLPSGWAAGDILLGAIIGISTNADTNVEIPAGFVSLGSYGGLYAFGGGNDWGLTIFAKRAEVGEAAPTAVCVAGGVNSRTHVLCAYRPPKPDWDLQFDQLPKPNLPANGNPGLVTTKTGIARRRSRLVIMSACTTSFGAATVPTPPTGLTQRENYLYNGFQRMYCWDGVVAKGDQISRAVQWSPFANNQVTGTFSILL